MNYTGVNESGRYDYVTEQARSLTQVSSMVAKFLYTLATGENNTDHVVVSETTVSKHSGVLFTLATNYNQTDNMDNTDKKDSTILCWLFCLP